MRAFRNPPYARVTRGFTRAMRARRPPEGGGGNPFRVTGHSLSGGSSAPKFSFVQSSGTSQGRYDFVPSRSLGTSPLISPVQRWTSGSAGAGLFSQPASPSQLARKDALRPGDGVRPGRTAMHGTTLNQLLAGDGATSTALDALLGDEHADVFVRSPTRKPAPEHSDGGICALQRSGPRARVSSLDAANRRDADLNEQHSLPMQRHLRPNQDAPPSQWPAGAVASSPGSVDPSRTAYRLGRGGRAGSDRRLPTSTHAESGASAARPSPRDMVEHATEGPWNAPPGAHRQLRGSNVSGLLALSDKHHQPPPQGGVGNAPGVRIPLGVAGVTSGDAGLSTRERASGEREGSGSNTSKTAASEALTRALNLRTEPPPAGMYKMPAGMYKILASKRNQKYLPPNETNTCPQKTPSRRWQVCIRCRQVCIKYQSARTPQNRACSKDGGFGGCIRLLALLAC